MKLPDVLDSKVIAKTNLFCIEQRHLRFSNGEERYYERFMAHSRFAVMVLPILNNENLVLIREYGGGIHDYYLGFPKGAMSKLEDDPLLTANRELSEEAGYAARSLKLMTSLNGSPSYSMSKMHVVIAEDLYEHRLPHDEPEMCEVVLWPIEKVDELIEHPEFNDPRCLVALLLYMRRRDAK